jgi:hypothetical protein
VVGRMPHNVPVAYPYTSTLTIIAG